MLILSACRTASFACALQVACSQTAAKYIPSPKSCAFALTRSPLCAQLASASAQPVFSNSSSVLVEKEAEPAPKPKPLKRTVSKKKADAGEHALQRGSSLSLHSSY